MSRVLLLCPEPLGHGHPAGVGIRFIEIARALRAEGHEVTLLSPDGAVIEGCRSGELRPEVIRDSSLQCDVVVVQGSAGNEFFSHGAARPVVVDLYDPYAVEHLHYESRHGGDVFVHNHRTLMRSLHRGDFYLCASEAQRIFYLGLLLATGRLNPVAYESDPTASRLIAVAPFGVPPARSVPERKPGPPALLFGGIYDWYDPIVAIDAVAIARAALPSLTLTFTRHPNAELTPQDAAAAAERYVAERGMSDVVHFVPWTAYDERATFYDRFTAALLAFPPSIETDLAMRTRVLDYLWAGLPVISSPGRGTDEIIERHRAGVIVREPAAEAFAAAIVGTLSDRERLRSMVAGAISFAKEHQWDRTLRPLLDFCAAPRFDESRDTFTRLESDVARLERDKQELIAALGSTRLLLESEVSLRQSQASELDSARTRIGELEALVRESDAVTARLRSELAASAERLSALEGDRAGLKELADRQQVAINDQTRATAALFSEIERLNGLLDRIYGSRTWKLHKALSRLKGER